MTSDKPDSPPTGWGEFELYEKLGQIFQISSDRIDLVKLNRCSPLLGYIIAREGKVLYESEPGLFIRFQLKAWKIYADTAKLRRYQAEYIRQGLERLKK